MGVSLNGILTKGVSLFNTTGGVKQTLRDSPAVVRERAEIEVKAVRCSPEVNEQELLQVVAAVAAISFDVPAAAAILRKTGSVGARALVAEDLHHLPGGIHCWVNGLPTLIGGRSFLCRLGIDIGECLHSSEAGEEIFVAQGKRLLGCIWLSA